MKYLNQNRLEQIVSVLLFSVKCTLHNVRFLSQTFCVAPSKLALFAIYYELLFT